MKISLRLEKIINMIPKGECLADIGTDHGYVPIYAIKKGIVNKAIATDVNNGPINRAKKNIKANNLEDVIDLRIGNGLSAIQKGETDILVITGMGGNLIAEIINSNLKIALSNKYMILQPIQFPELLRKYLSVSNFSIYDEDIIQENGKFYQIILVSKGKGDIYKNEALFYTGNILIEKKHPDLKKFVIFKINILKGVLINLQDGYNEEEKKKISKLIVEFEDVLKCL